MDLPAAHYEVIFTLHGALIAGRFRWSWIKLDVNGLVTIHGKPHATMRAAIDDATAHRREHGGGGIRVNIQGNVREDAPDVTYLT